MAINTTTQLTQPVNVIAQAKFLRSAKPRCPHFVGSLPGTIMSQNGSFTIQWRTMAALSPATTALTALSGTYDAPTRAGSALSVSDTTATLSKYGDFVFVNEEADLVNYSTQTAKIMETLGIQAGRTFNRLHRNTVEDNFTKVYTDTGSADSDVVSPIGLGVIRSVRNTLNRQSALEFTPETTGSTNIGTSPVRPSFWGICHSDVEEDIRQLAGFIAVERYAGQTMTANGEFGVVEGIRWLSTPEASIDADSGGAQSGTRSTSGTNADLYSSVVFGMEAHGSVSLDASLIREVYMAGDDIPGVMIISHDRTSGGTSDPLNELMSVGWKGWYAGSVLNSNWGRAIRSAASLLQ